ncbi:hypothetical protein [Streptomyces sp. VRA16 Mangrove soil]|uniref:hypothetical protein n=1 Tax=Streptomyces sp. VRA16 Mangrove soil TaxID=2817434 RepID=UPI001A9E6E14|nr:hypothetical protein [Streptomyces sp. VRA16 Mangrove soil]MBO1335567.1 hypothetical protein [Streptomyces sp. VRA16 Mangrove soil]
MSGPLDLERPEGARGTARGRTTIRTRPRTKRGPGTQSPVSGRDGTAGAPSLTRTTAGAAPSPRTDQPTTTLRLARPDDPVNDLAASLADVVAAAVHPYEVAALLEAQGMTADRIRDTYGHPDLFTLAEAVYHRVPRDPPAPPLPVNPWRPDHLRCALRGLLFALPGAAYLLAAGAWRTTAGLHGLIAAALVSWAWTQALSHRAYVRLVSGRRAAARTLLIGAPLGAATATGAGLAVAGPGPGALFAAAQSAYLAAAGVLLVFGRERLLAGALAPVAAGAAALVRWHPPGALRTGLTLLTLALAIAAAAHTIRTALRAPVPAVEGPRPPLRASLPYGLFGLAAGILTLLAGREHPYAVVVLTLSMGPAEWLLHHYRGLAVSALHASTTPGGFLLRATRALLLCEAVYLTALAGGALAISSPVAELLALGAVLWSALLMQAFGAAWTPAALTGAAAASALVLPAPLSTAAAACLLLALAVRHLGVPTAHA